MIQRMPATVARNVNGRSTIFDLDLRHQDWKLKAICPQVDPVIFFPHKGGSTSEARAVCGRCEVREECLLEAMEFEEMPHGVWGGLAGKDLRNARKVYQAERAAEEAEEACA